jgi:hypothetical protein
MGFGFLPTTTGRQALRGAKLMAEESFETLGVDHMFGTTPDLNTEAVRFVKLLGFKMVAHIPNFCSYLGEYCGAYTSYISREEWTTTKLASLSRKQTPTTEPTPSSLAPEYVSSAIPSPLALS